jgi:hypothetical protein
MKTWEGLGTIKYKEGHTYQGFTQNKLFHGKGRLTQACGDIYQGEFKEGKANGNGVFI